MLIQRRQDGRLRLFRQHDHALAAGALACAWRGLDRDAEPLGFPLVLSVGLHDLAWRELDEEPLRGGGGGHPLAFYEYPLPPKLAAYTRGLDATERIHPYAALLVSRHYAGFVERERSEGGRGAGEDSAATRFLEEEDARRARLVASLELGLEEQARQHRHLKWLQMFDAISIFLCLTPPPSDPDSHPAWVERARHAETPDGRHVHLTWRDEDVVHVDPFPFGDTLEIRLPYRELPPPPYADQEALREVWEGAEDRVWWLTLGPSPRLA